MSCYFRRLIVNSFVFFFQAEDGIRDFHVTGVQTCALPISAQKGASPQQAQELEARLAAMAALVPYAELPGAGAAGGLGAALAALGSQLVRGAGLVLDTVGFDANAYDLVVTGEGTVDATTRRGKAPGEVARRCLAAGVRCVVFGGRVVEPVEGVETVSLSGTPARAREDLVALGRALEP